MARLDERMRALEERMRARFRVGEYDAARLEGVRDLWREEHDEASVSRREALFRWLTEGNPFLEGRTPYYLLLDGEHVIGMHGHMPLAISFWGSVEPCHLAHDDLLALKFRGRGLGKIMLDGVASRVPTFAGSLWHNEENRRLYEMAGWSSVEDLVPYLKVYDPIVFLRGRLGNELLTRFASAVLGVGLRLWDRWLSRRSASAIRIESVERFDERFDRFFDAISERLGVAVVRSAAYLNWKFVDKPYNAYRRRMALDEDGSLLGYVVSKRERSSGGSRGLIVDILADPQRPRVFGELVRESIRELANERVSYVSLLCSHPLFTPELRRLGFVRARTPMNFMITNFENRPDKDRIRQLRHWYITHSDADGDAWTVDLK